MKFKKLPPLEYLNECFKISTDSPSGLKWKTRPDYHFISPKKALVWNRDYAGQNVGTLLNEGYYVTSVNRIKYFIHRIIFCIHNNCEGVDFIIDHIDRNKSNNSPENLRTVTKSENGLNRLATSSNTSGFKNISWSKTDKAWRVQIGINNKRFHIGLYKDLEEAKVVAEQARAEHHKDFSVS